MLWLALRLLARLLLDVLALLSLHQERLIVALATIHRVLLRVARLPVLRVTAITQRPHLWSSTQ